VGQQGLAGIAVTCVAKAHYLHDALLATGKFTSPWDAHFGYEFTLRYEGDVATMHEEMLDAGFLAGVSVFDVEGEWPTGVEASENLVVFAVTEKRTKEEMDAFVEEVASL